MKAIVCTQYGSPDVLEFKEVPKPEPNDDEVLIEVRASSVSAGVWHLMRGEPVLMRLLFGFSKPKYTILGASVAGRVEAVGRNVTQFRAGDEVFGDLSSCGFGAFAEYATATENALVAKPANVSFEQAAAVPGSALAALKGLRDKGHIQSGQAVLVNGASGGVGSFAVQIAKSFGAQVTGVCSTGKVDMVSALGADKVIDYNKQNFTENGARYDLILDAAAHYSVFDCRRALKPNGTYVMVGGPTRALLQVVLLGPILSMMDGKTVTNLLSTPSQPDLIVLQNLLESGDLAPVIDRSYPLREVPDAIRYLEAGRARGKIVISISTAA